MSNPIDQHINTITLEQLQVYAREVASGWMLSQMDVHVAHDIICNNLVATLMTTVLSDRIEGEDVTVTTDEWSSWWQHTKAVHFPTLSRWVRRPPRKVERRHTFNVRHLVTFPEYNRAYPRDLGRPVHLSWVQPYPEKG